MEAGRSPEGTVEAGGTAAVSSAETTPAGVTLSYDSCLKQNENIGLL